jgi:hypothetical protein
MPDVTASPTCSLAVVVGAPAFISVLPQDKPVLVIEADLQRSRQLSEDLDGHPNPVTIISEVLTAEEGSQVEWHHYNDSRLDGPTDLATWQQSYPNLHLLSLETRDGRLLKDLIQDWADKHAPKQTLLLDIALRQGDPLAALIAADLPAADATEEKPAGAKPPSANPRRPLQALGACPALLEALSREWAQSLAATPPDHHGPASVDR